MKQTKSPGDHRAFSSALRGAARALSLLVVACGSQAGDGYLGEPMLNLRGHAVVSAATGGEPIVPALCFTEALSPEFRKPRPMRLDDLPEEITRDLRGRVLSGEFTEEQDPPPPDYDTLTHILDVQSNGSFPSEFNIDVYSPPAEKALKPLFSGETRVGIAFICAAKAKHRAVTHAVQQVERRDCVFVDDDFTKPVSCWERRLWIVTPTRRFYTERYDCSPKYPTDCKLTSSAGDRSLKLENVAEDVLGAAQLPLIYYLERDAPPESRTAWALGAGGIGLAAGYHVFTDWPSPDPMACAPSTEEILAVLTPPWDSDPTLADRLRGEPEALTEEQLQAVEEARVAASMKRCPSWRAQSDPNRPVSIEISPELPPLEGFPFPR